MTRPIYEPSLQRTDRRLGYTSDQLLRRPAPTSAGCCPCWIAVDTANQGYEADGNGNTVEWLEVWLPTGCEDVFSYTVIEGGGQFGDDIVYPNLLLSGVYTYNVNIFFDSDPDLTAQSFKFRLGIEVIDGGGSNDPFPGRQGASAFQYFTFYLPENNDFDADINETVSMTLPINQTSGNYPLRTGDVTLDWSATYTDIVSVREYITYHGPTGWPDGNFVTPTWP